jgi:hypothetical protein
MIKKKKTKSLPKLKKELQIIFNNFIRLRDEGQCCISCGEYKNILQAGHFYHVGGYDVLRFNELNTNGECVGCNCFNESHLIGYSENLLEKIGTEKYEALKDAAADYKRNGYKWSRSDLVEKIAYYKEKVKEFNN